MGQRESRSVLNAYSEDIRSGNLKGGPPSHLSSAEVLGDKEGGGVDFAPMKRCSGYMPRRSTAPMFNSKVCQRKVYRYVYLLHIILL